MDEVARIKVVLTYRSKVRGRYSIETLFSAVAQVLRGEVDVVEYSLTSKWGNWRDIWALRRLKADVYHVTGDVHYIALMMPYHKTIITVHDLNHYLYRLRGVRRWVFKKLWFDWPLSRVAAVTAISEKTKSDLMEHCRGIGSKIRVIENCVSPRYKPAPLKFNESYPRILFVGTAPHKNLRRLSVALHGIPCKLVVVGPIGAAMWDELKRLGLDIENHIDLNEEDLYQQYVASDLVAFVSEREGFGLPIIEAQAVGRPVITSNLSPMREVAGDGAHLVDPFDVGQMRSGIQKIIGDPLYRQQLVVRGLQNVSRFTVETVAAKYLNLYKEVAGTHVDAGSI